MKFDKVSAVAAIIAIAISVSLYPRLPSQVPVHWGLTGKPDSWGPPATIFILPVGALIANLSIMSAEEPDIRARTRKARLVVGALLAGETFALYWIFTHL